MFLGARNDHLLSEQRPTALLRAWIPKLAAKRVDDEQMIEEFVFRLDPDLKEALPIVARHEECIRMGILTLKAEAGSALYEEVAEAQMRAMDAGRAVVLSWSVRRKYSKSELDSADWFTIQARSVVPTFGEECGTRFDESRACRHVLSADLPGSVCGVDYVIPGRVCGVGWRQTSALRLDRCNKSRRVDAWTTFGGEFIVSAKGRSAIERVCGDSVSFEAVEFVNRAASACCDWYQLRDVQGEVAVSNRTVSGNGPFDISRSPVCPAGHYLGLNRISELWIDRVPMGARGIWLTRELFGVRRGFLRPLPEIVVSRQVRNECTRVGVKGVEWEVARVADTVCDS